MRVGNGKFFVAPKGAKPWWQHWATDVAHDLHCRSAAFINYPHEEQSVKYYSLREMRYEPSAIT